MAIRIVRLGTKRIRGEGPRFGTVRRPPRGVPRSKFAAQNWYDFWLPVVAPSEATLKLGRKVTTRAGWRRFAGRYHAEMRLPAANQAIDLLAALSHRANFSVGCYCEDESRCHRSLLRAMLIARGAVVR